MTSLWGYVQCGGWWYSPAMKLTSVIALLLAAMPLAAQTPDRTQQLLQRLADIIGRPELLKLGARPAPPGEPAVLVPDIGRLSGDVGWRPRRLLDEGLRETVRWWRARAA